MKLHHNHLYTWVLLIGWVLTVCNLTSLQKLVLKITLNNASKNKCLTPVCGKLVSSQTWTAVLTALRVLLSSRNKFKFAWANIKQVNSNNSNASCMENRQVSSSKTKVAWIDISVTLTILSNKTELAGEDLGHVRLGIFRNKNVFRNIFRLFCSWQQNSQNGIQVFRNENSSQTNASLHYSNYSYSGLIPNERALSYVCFTQHI